jgi:hypothetical protein
MDMVRDSDVRTACGTYTDFVHQHIGMAWAFRAAEALVTMMTEGEAPTWFPQTFDIKRAWNYTAAE